MERDSSSYEFPAKKSKKQQKKKENKETISG